MVEKIKIRGNEAAFTKTEVLASLVVLGFLMTSVSTVLLTATNVNQKAERRTEASELAFAKLQDYVNRRYTNIPVRDDLTNYEVETFTASLTSSKLSDPAGVVYVEPESNADPVVAVNSTLFSQGVSAESVAKDGYKAMMEGRPEITSGMSNKILASVVSRLIPYNLQVRAVSSLGDI